MAQQTEDLKGQPLRRFFRLLAPDRKEILYVYIYAVFNGLVNLSLPLGIQAIIGLTLADRISTSWIVLIVVVTLGTAMAGGLQIMQISLTEMLQQRIFTRASFEFAYRLPRIRTEALLKYYPPELINRFFDVVNVQKGLPKLLIDFSTALLQVIFGLILLSFYNSAFVFFGIGLILLLALIFRITGPSGLKTSLEESNFKYEVAYWLEEIARTLGSFKLAGDTDLAMRKTDDLVSNYLTARKAHFRVLVFQYSNIVVFKTVITAGLLILGSVLLIDRQINLGQFVASEIIILIIISSVEKLILSMDTIYDVLTALEKIGKVTDLPLEHGSGRDFMEIKGDKRGMDVHVQDLSFAYPGENRSSLEDISFDLKPGGRLCISGSSGSGKTLLLNLLGGIYHSFEGGIAYNNIPLRNYDAMKLRSNIGEVLSQKVLFRGTIEENLTMGRKDVTFDDLRWVMRNLGLTEFLQTLPQGLDTMLVPEGPQLPQSIVRKMIIARSCVHRPQLILIDDLLTIMEEQERIQIADFLINTDCWTLIAASNDPVLASRFERVLVMEQGTVIDEGTFEELSKKPYANRVFTR